MQRRLTALVMNGLGLINHNYLSPKRVKGLMNISLILQKLKIFLAGTLNSLLVKVFIRWSSGSLQKVDCKIGTSKDYQLNTVKHHNLH